MLVGYCRVSMADDRQTTDLQRDALMAVGIDHRNIYEDRVSGAKDDRPGLKACLDYLTEGDILVVWRLDRLGRSLPHLIEIVTGLRSRGIGFRSLNETIDTTTATGELLFHIFGALGPVRASADPRACNRWHYVQRNEGAVEEDDHVRWIRKK